MAKLLIATFSFLSPRTKLTEQKRNASGSKTRHYEKCLSAEKLCHFITETLGGKVV